MEPISKSVVRKDHAPKITGTSIYVDDYANTGVLTGRFLRSKTARARIVSVTVPELPPGYFYVDKDDVPGVNKVHIVMDDTPVFAQDTVEYIGEPIAMVVGPDVRQVEAILAGIRVEYEELEPVLDLRRADTVFFDYEYGRGDLEKAFAEADQVFTEEFSTGYQDQTYLETQGHDGPAGAGRPHVCPRLPPVRLLCAHRPDAGLRLRPGGRACPPGCDRRRLRRQGGLSLHPGLSGGGGREKGRCAGALRIQPQGRFGIYSKRHPSLCTYRAAVKDGRVTAMDIEVLFNAGAYTTLSAVVLQRGVICASGVYNIEHLHVHGKALKTNTVPSGAYRGFGAPQTFFAVEMFMDHIAKDLGEDSLEFKERHLVKQGDKTSTSGIYHFPVPLPDMIEEVSAACDFRRKHKEYARLQTGRFRRGIGMSCIFTGRDLPAPGSGISSRRSAAWQSMRTAPWKYWPPTERSARGCALPSQRSWQRSWAFLWKRSVLSIRIRPGFPTPAPTVASRSLMIVGELLRRCAVRLREAWIDGEEQMVEEHFKEPDFMIPFYLDKFQGDAYPTYAWGVNAIEVEVDTYTGLTKILGAYGSFDVGTPWTRASSWARWRAVSSRGIGYASMESMDYDSRGRIRNNSFSDYLIPTAADVPNLTCMLHVEKYPDGPYGAKGAGELPLVGAPGAYVEAMEQALGGSVRLHHAPFTPEDT